MESDNLKTASLYINNQLLSRGLLRNGQTIEFARPERGDGGSEGTMGRIMSVVNDLILRRDRDATQRETLSQTIRTLRADSLRQTTELERLQSKHAEAQRKLGIADATERGFKMQIKSAEQAARGLKEEMGKMRLLVAQTRSQCANEVRKRERTIEGLKRHVGEGGRARGGGKPVGVVCVTVLPGVGGDGGAGGGVVGTEDSMYDLRSETNEFLTELARGLSEENENVGALLKRTVDTLRVLSGCEKENGVAQEGGAVVQLDGGYEDLAAEMDGVIEHLRNLLTNPSFVPLEEVEVREEEIIRLRDGWEKMENRWKEAVLMMDGWRKRMARSGQTVNLEELKMGLMLSPLKPKEEESAHAGFQLSTLMEEGEDDTQADIDAMDDSGLPPPEPEFDDDSEDSESSLFEDEPVGNVSEEPFEEQEEQEEQDCTIETATSASPGPAPQLSPLRETTGNKVAYPNGPQKDAFTTIIEENTYDLLQLDPSSPQKAPKSAKPTPQTQTQPKRPSSSLNQSITTEDEVSLLKTSVISQPSQPLPRSRSTSPKKRSQSPQKSLRPTALTSQQNVKATPKLKSDPSSRLPRPRDNPPPQQSPLTMASIAAKLAATEREADAARVRAKIKAAKLSRMSSEKEPLAPSQPVVVSVPTKKGDDEEDGDIRGKKRKVGNGRQGGRASRRRSTLSPWEMESLILGGLGAGVSPGKEL